MHFGINLWRLFAIVMSGMLIVLEFDQRNFGKQPISGTLILHVAGFTTLQVVGFGFRKTRPNDLAIGITFLGFYIWTSMWLMIAVND